MTAAATARLGAIAPQPFRDVARLSLNQMTTDRVNLRDVLDACARHQIPSVGIWRHKIAETGGGLESAVRLVRDSGVRVSSVCRGGMFPAATRQEREQRITDNLRAIDEAAALGAPVLVLVCGPSPDRDIDAARRMVEEGIGRIATHAAERHVMLGIEPLHPAFAAERSCITTLREARLLAEKFDAGTVGVVADVYHIWWDADVHAEMARCAGRLAGFHVSDWLVPCTDVLVNRGMMGDGVIELRRLRESAERAGWDGPIEVEIFNEAVWQTPIDVLLPLMKERFLTCV